MSSRSKVHLTADAREDFRDLDGATRKIVAKALRKLETEPEKRGAPLGSRGSGDLSTYRKLVVGNKDCRIVYRVEPDGTVCVVWVIAKRSDDEVYNLAVARLAGVEQSDLVKQLRSVLEQAKDL
ncbi:MAG: type II toxin-antitoxin system RelE/ParE family toxin [Aeromicrobium sp.]|jgi:mRNA interferase RelE/StbE|nr:MAG: type II toxin-antitoxin system RelE/ParE family toxin [Aeromicrobium sp.]